MRRLTAVAAGATLTLTALGVPPAVAAAPIATQILLDLHPTPGVVGDSVVVLGRLERKAGRAGVGDRSVRLAVTADNGSELAYLGTATTNDDGTFTRTVKAPRSGRWRASFQPVAGDDHLASASQTDWIGLKHRTRIDGYSVTPRVPVLGTRITVKGRAVRLAVTGPAPIARGRVHLLSSRDGKTWSPRGSALTDNAGNFAFRPVVTADGYWTTRFPAAGTDLGSSSGIAFVDGKHRTRLTLDARPEPIQRGKRLTITGTLLQVNANGSTTPMSGRLVRIFVRPDGTTKSRLLGTARTGPRGVYTFHYHPTVTSSFSARWVGVGDHLTSSTGWDRVVVRR
ncbi:MAG TPA: hypothetical protein VHJ17_12505 [Thermomonospora sp.]|nr:hypothetical protein [Thermomonospora sp.]